MLGGLLVLCLMLPVLATYALRAVPVLVGLIVCVAALRLALPKSKRR
jgi:hypothetical protein